MQPAIDGASASRRVLVVEDDPAISSLMQAVLRDAGATIDVATDGPAALTIASDQQPDLVILDLGLPNMYGTAVAEQLRQQLGSVPILVVSALPASAVAADAWQIGAFTYITKPFELDAFSAAVQRGLAISQQERRRSGEQRPAPRPAPRARRRPARGRVLGRR